MPVFRIRYNILYTVYKQLYYKINKLYVIMVVTCEHGYFVIGLNKRLHHHLYI